MTDPRKIKEAFLAVGASSTLGGIGVFVYQLITWLRDGYWTGISVNDEIIKIFSLDYSSWFVYPDSWYGIHSIIEWFPLSLALLVGGLLLVVIYINLDLE